MKKIFVVFLLIWVFTTAVAQTNRLQNYHVSSFGGVTRISFTFTQRPITNVIKEANSLRMTINIPSCEIGNIPTTFTTPDALSRSISISNLNRDLNIEIATSTAFSTIRQSASQDSAYHLNIDIFRNLPATDISDYVALLDYYHFTKNNAAVSETLSDIPYVFGNDRKIADRQQNRFAAPIVYTPRAITRQTAQTTRPTQTKPPTTSQQPPATNQPPPPPVTVSRPTDVPPTPSQPAQLPPATTSQTPTGDTSFTLITRTDRFPTRIPQTKDIFNDRPARNLPTPTEPPPISPEPTDTIDQPPPAQTTPPPVSTPPVTTQPPVATHPAVPSPPSTRTVIDIADLQDIERQILNYYNIVKIDSTRANFMVGLNANIAGDYHTAIDYLKTIPDSDINYENAIRWLAESYLELGDTKNADFYNSLIKVNEPQATSTPPGFKRTWSVMTAAIQNKIIQWSGGENADPDSTDFTENMDFKDTPVKLWMAAALALLTLIIGIIITALIARAKKKKVKTPVPDAELDIHKKNIGTNIQNKDIYHKDSVETVNNETEVIIADSYDDPPLVTESLDKAEEEELIADEKQSVQTSTEPTDSSKDEPDLSEETEGKRKEVISLHNAGWSLDAIVRETQLSQSAVEFIIKTFNNG